MISEYPRWQTKAQPLIQNWGTCAPLTFDNVREEIFDTGGRPLFDSPGSINPARVPFQYEPGLTDGGRDEYPVNISAFHEVAKVFPDALGLISYLHGIIQPYHNKTTAGGIESILTTVEGLHRWMVLRADNPIQNGQVSTYLAGASKIALGGLRPFYDDMLYEVIGIGRSTDKSVPLTTENFIDKVFGEGLLVINNGEELSRISKEACPAPRIMIERFAQVLFDTPTDNASEVGKRLGLSLGEIQQARQFGKAYTQGLNVIDFLRQFSNKHGLSVTPMGNVVNIFGATYPTKTIDRCVIALNGVQKRINESLGERPQRLTLRDILSSIASTSAAAFGIKEYTVFPDDQQLEAELLQVLSFS